MSLLDTIKTDFVQSLKDKQTIKQNILKLVKSETDRNITSDITDEYVIEIIIKLIKYNRETIVFLSGNKVSDDAKRNILKKEIKILFQYLPDAVTIKDIIKDITDEERLKVIESKHIGRGTGILIKILKSSERYKNLRLEGPTVALAVKKLLENE